MKVLISPTSFGECGPRPLELLASHGIEVTLNPCHRKLTAEEAVELGRDCDGIIAGVEPLGAEVLSKLPKLRCISRVGVGLQNVDLEAAKDRGIAVLNTPDGPSRAVAELAVGLTFALLRRIPLADRNVRTGVWKKEMGYLLLGKTVGIVGLGQIGRITAELFLALGCEVVASDPAPNRDWLANHPVTLMSLGEMIPRCDIVSLHLAVMPEDEPIIGARELEMMKEHAFLLNLSRGEAVDEEALYRTLSSGGIAGAGLDVFETEPYHGPLAKSDQVILTPHLGSYAREARLRMEILAVENLLGVFDRQG